MPDPVVVPSIGMDAPTLATFKQYCGLPPDPAWTEKDTLLRGLLSAAERWMDEATGTTYRTRSFTVSFTPEDIICSPTLIVPVRVIDLATVNFVWQSDAVAFTGYNFSHLTVRPKLVCNFDRTSFEDSDACPLIGTFQTLPSTNETHLTTIMMLGAHFYQNPSAVGKKELSFSRAFDSLLTSLRISFL